MARQIAQKCSWRNLKIDPESKTLLNYGRDRYLPPKILTDFLKARDQRCRFPGCRAGLYRSEIDHAIAWEAGGRTDVDNLGLLCKRHHQLKTHRGWKLESNDDGSCLWTSPKGKQYFVEARSVLEEV